MRSSFTGDVMKLAWMWRNIKDLLTIDLWDCRIMFQMHFRVPAPKLKEIWINLEESIFKKYCLNPFFFFYNLCHLCRSKSTTLHSEKRVIVEYFCSGNTLSFLLKLENKSRFQFLCRWGRYKVEKCGTNLRCRKQRHEQPYFHCKGRYINKNW